jgi:HSP20 family protein
MNKPALKYTLIAILGIGAIGAVAAQSYYTHELVQRVADQSGPAPATAPPTAAAAQRDPWHEMQRLQARMEQMFDQSFAALPVATPGDAARITLEQQPDNYIVRAVIPGATESDIKVNLDGRLLSISSHTRGSEKQTAQNGSVTQEATYSGAFEEAFTLPGPVVASEMKSDFKDGELTLTIPKATS